jgi:hypothetical protein
MENYVLIPDRRGGIDGSITTPEMAPWPDPTYRPVCLRNLLLAWIKHCVHVMRKLDSSNSNTLFRWHTAAAFFMQSSVNYSLVGVSGGGGLIKKRKALTKKKFDVEISSKQRCADGRLTGSSSNRTSVMQVRSHQVEFFQGTFISSDVRYEGVCG